MDVKSWRVVEEGFILGTYYAEGETVRLNVKQARSFLREGRISDPVKRKVKPADKGDQG